MNTATDLTVMANKTVCTITAPRCSRQCCGQILVFVSDVVGSACTGAVAYSSNLCGYG